MVQQVTNGIKISVSSNFEGTTYRNHRLYYAFSYQVTIENQSNETVQLLERFWKIYDSLNKTEIVEGSGVIGKKPILNPSEKYTYQSNCFLSSPIGAMNGHYNMVTLATTKSFKVYIPTFQLMVTNMSN
ncbi:Co2+/Mg2+ efflux protein ApaG [Lutibacter sp. HS1-25]|uniref:Co2+/Mg2+ efflux protein ApaG n=1 Tax=Lutibacter sp. HS1-25 TaxID=2485000 RepID=UPI00101102E0|nr:Co2+/Mg2+ efflux protein ApaG [Lutibacter sp. HS1-25]RXP64613.1 Co2+/Mg2+ efflux protein ApaG [Lutibacter sp. HS1-25]